jgi:hypothetical protein
VQALDILNGRDVELPAEARKREQASMQTTLHPGLQGSSTVTPYGFYGRLPRPWRQAPKSPPAGSRLEVDDSGGQLVIETPPAGLSSSVAATGAFAVAWNAFVAFWTMGAVAGGGVLFALFSTPFWFAGATMLRSTVLGALLRESVVLGGSGWQVKQELARIQGGVAKFLGAGLQRGGGDLADLQGASVLAPAFFGFVHVLE